MTSSRHPADSAGHVAALDGVRALAAFGVIATHAGFNSGRSLDDGPLAPLLSRLDFGVTLFFLLSGYLLFRPFVAAAIERAPGPRIGSFWWRRTLRILPAYWLATAVTLGFMSVRPASSTDWWSYLLLVQTYNGHDLDPSLTQMWTLAVEISFYAALPLLAVLARRIRSQRSPVTGPLGLVGTLCVAALVANVWTHGDSGDASTGLLWLPVYLDWFALGMLLAIASCLPDNHSRWRGVLGQWANAPGTCWVTGALVFWIATLPICGPRNLVPATAWEWTTKHYVYGCAAFLFLLPNVLGTTRWPQRLLGNPVARWMGQISYGVYLWHLGVLIAVQRWLGWRTFGGHFIELFVLTAVISTAIAAASWHLVERPLLRRFSRSWWRFAKTADRESSDARDTEKLHSGATGERVR